MTNDSSPPPGVEGAKKDGREFQLESPRAGVPAPPVIEELRKLRRLAADAVYTYTSAIQTQAEKCGLKRGALRKFIGALESDKVDEAEQEAVDLERLIDSL